MMRSGGLHPNQYARFLYSIPSHASRQKKWATPEYILSEGVKSMTMPFAELGAKSVVMQYL